MLLTDQTVSDMFTFNVRAYILGKFLSTRFTFLKLAKEARDGDKNAKDTIQKLRRHMVAYAQRLLTIVYANSH